MIKGGDGREYPYIERVHYRADTKHPESFAFVLHRKRGGLFDEQLFETLDKVKGLLFLIYVYEETDAQAIQEGEQKIDSLLSSVQDEGRYMSGINPFLNAWNRHYTHPEEFTKEELSEAEILRHSPRMGQPLPQANS